MTTNGDQREQRPTPEDYFAEGLKSALDRQKLSQQRLAEEMAERGHKFHQATVYKILNKVRKVTLGEALDIADIVGVDLENLIVPEHERNLAQLGHEARRCLNTIEKATRDYLAARKRMFEDFEARSDWLPSTVDAINAWREVARGPERAVEVGRRQWAYVQERMEQQRRDHLVRRRREMERKANGEYPEAP